MEMNFLINEDKYRGDILFSFCLLGNSMDVSSPKDLEGAKSSFSHTRQTFMSLMCKDLMGMTL
jgi:hypothetical protein